MEVPLYHISGEKDYPWRSICIRKRTTMSVMAIMNLSSLSLLRWFAFRFLFCRGCCIYNCCCHRWQIMYKDSTKLFSFLLIRHILIDEWKRQRNREKSKFYWHLPQSFSFFLCLSTSFCLSDCVSLCLYLLYPPSLTRDIKHVGKRREIATIISYNDDHKNDEIVNMKIRE